MADVPNGPASCSTHLALEGGAMRLSIYHAMMAEARAVDADARYERGVAAIRAAIAAREAK